MACCDATASGPGAVAGCAFGVAAVEAFDRGPFVVAVGVVVGEAVDRVAVIASSVVVAEIAGIVGDDAEWEERLVIAVRVLGTAPA